MGSRQIKQFCRVADDVKDLLRAAIAQLGLSARAYDRILKLARTIADLDAQDDIQLAHVAEAIQYRALDRKLWGVKRHCAPRGDSNNAPPQFTDHEEVLLMSYSPRYFLDRLSHGASYLMIAILALAALALTTPERLSAAALPPAAASQTTYAAPTITSFTPTSGKFPDIVTITGTGFTGATQVTIGGVPSASITVVSPTQIKALVRSLAVTGPIAVTTPHGTATSSQVFTITGSVNGETGAAPTITGFTPASGKFPDFVTITGTGFTSATQVAINGVPSAIINVVSPTVIKALVRSLATTGLITVTTPHGTATSSDVFTVTWTANEGPGSAPVITGFTPSSGKFPDIVTITGTGFTGATQVTIGSIPSASITVVSPTQIKALVRSLAVTGPITVTTMRGTGTSAGIFTVMPLK